MSVYEPDNLNQFKDFIDRNTFVIAVTAFGEDNTSETIFYNLNTLLGSFPNVRCAKIEMENMHDFANEYDIGMPCIVYFNNGTKVHQNGSTNYGTIEYDLEKYCSN